MFATVCMQTTGARWSRFTHQNIPICYSCLGKDWQSNQQWGGQHQTDTRWLGPYPPPQRRSPGNFAGGTGWRTLQICANAQQPTKRNTRMSSNCSQNLKEHSGMLLHIRAAESKSVPPGLIVISLCDDETGEMVDQLQGHTQLHDPLHHFFLLMTKS